MANEYLQRTPTSTGNRRVWTWSAWIKKGTSGVANPTLFSAGNNNFVIRMDDNSSSDKIELYHYNGSTYDYRYITNLRNRDVSSWLNIVLISDTTASTSSDRIKIYINGYLVTDFGTRTDPSINFLSYVSNVNIHSIGANNASGSPLGYYNGYISDQFFIDGQALTPDVFGFNKVGKGYISAGSTQSTDFRPGQWVPKTPRVIKTAINNSGGFGVNGFYLPMNDSNNFGADFHCDPNSIIKLQENLPQPRSRIDGVGDYTGALRDDPFKQYLVLAVPGVVGGQGSGYGDYSANIKGSGSNKTVTANGNAGVAATASYYGSALSFDGTGDFFSISSSSDFAFGTGDYTLECWVYHSSLTGQQTYFGDTFGNTAGVYFYKLSDNKIGIYYSSNIVTGGSITLGQWNHIAASRYSGILTLFINGVAVGVGADTANLTTTEYYIGDNAGTSSGGMFGYIQDLRIYKGVAKYKGGFDVPRPYTPVGIATWRAVPDTTANNFATLNPLTNSNAPLTNGNLTMSPSGNNASAWSTFAVKSGKWYWEVYKSSGDMALMLSQLARFNGYQPAADTTGLSLYMYYSSGGTSTNRFRYNASDTAFPSGFGDDDNGTLYNFFLDFDTNTFKVRRNNDAATEASFSMPAALVSEPLFIGYSVISTWPAGSFTYNFGQNPTFSGNTTAGTYTDSNNKGLFKYQPPSGFLALCEDNLPTPAISDPGKHFKTVLWTGDGNSGRSISGVGFQPDLVWIKSRTVARNHRLQDSVRGFTNVLSSDLTNVEYGTGDVSSANNEGFSLLARDNQNVSAESYVAWCWRAGAGTTSTNTNGSITSVVSVNQDAGFSIVSGLSGGSSGSVFDSFGHGLGKTPSFILVKNRDIVDYFYAYHKSLPTQYLVLGATNASAGAGGNTWGTSGPSSSVITTKQSSFASAAGQRFIFYCWAEIEGFSKFGSYTGNGSFDGPFVYCGFKPAWVMIKSTDASNGWIIMDNARKPINPNGEVLFANEAIIEQTDLNYRYTDFVSNGFKIRAGIGSERNSNGVPYIFVAFAESPFTTANAK